MIIEFRGDFTKLLSPGRNLHVLIKELAYALIVSPLTALMKSMRNTLQGLLIKEGMKPRGSPDAGMNGDAVGGRYSSTQHLYHIIWVQS